MGAYGFPSISGKAKNNTDSDGGNVYVSVALYDKSGEFILFRRFGIFDGSFVPDRWVRFNETIVSLSSIDDVGSYKVWVCPYQYQ